MKDKVTALAKGNFSYDTPVPVLKPSKLCVTVVAGEKKTEYIEISNSNKTKIKGFGSVEEQGIHFLPVFDDANNRLELVIDATIWFGRKKVQGQICFVTDCGEASLPYEITVQEPVLYDEFGSVPDYQTLKNRICSNPEQGAALFHSTEFRKIFLKNDTAGRIYYDHLVAKDDEMQSMEEFLVAMGKKQPVHMDIVYRKKRSAGAGMAKEAEYSLAGQDIHDSVQVKINTWGNFDIRVSATEDFIVPAVDTLKVNEFQDNVAILKYTIAAERVNPGKRQGKLILESPYEKKEFCIRVHNLEDEQKRKVERAKKAVFSTIVRMYLAYKEERVEKEEFQNLIWNNRRVIVKIENPYQAAVKGYIPAMLRDSAGMLGFYQDTENVQPPLPGAPLLDVENYILIQYIPYLYAKKEELAIELSKMLEVYQSEGYDSLLLFYIRLMVDAKYEDIRVRAQEVKERILSGENSPLLYSELIRMYKADPTLISELDKATIGAVCYGIRQGMITEDMAVVLSFLAERAGKFEPAVFHIMTSVYENSDSEDMLRAICSLLIRNEAADKKYFRWFESGVKKQLRITDLYEYYMYTMDRMKTASMPESVLSYFRYENHLNPVCKAFLYAYIIKKQSRFPEILPEYVDAIREFAMTQLYHHHISEDLGTIYEAVITHENMDEAIASELVQVMFTRLLTCYHPDMEGVVVVHTQTREEVYYPIVAGTAKVQIYTPDYQLYFVDRKGRYHTGTVEYRLQKLMQDEKYALSCYEKGAKDLMLLVSLAVSFERSASINGFQALIIRDTLQSDGLRNAAKARFFYCLYEFYKKKEDSVMLSDVICAWDMKLVKKEQAAAVACDCVHHGFYEKAEQLFARYGIYGADKKALAILIANRIQEKGGEFSPLLEKWSLYLYREHYYEWEPLYYLLKYYMGKTETLTAIHKKCKEFAPHRIEDGCRERVLGQVLFTGTSPLGYEELFEEYYVGGSNRILVKAFLSEYAYEYVTGKIDLQESIFVKIEKEAFYDKEIVMVLATLRYYSAMHAYAKKQQDFIEVQLERCAADGRILSFMKNFCGKLNVPYEVENCLFVEHYSGTDKGVFFFLKNEDGETYTSKPMKKVFDGIYTKELLLFAGEEKRGYIYEEETGKKTKEFSFRLNAGEAGERGFYPMLNGMIEAKEHMDREKYRRLRHLYLKNRQMADKLFQMH